MKSKHPALHLLRDYGVITLGCAIYAVSFQWFFQPNNIAMGASPAWDRSSTACSPFCRWVPSSS